MPFFKKFRQLLPAALVIFSLLFFVSFIKTDRHVSVLCAPFDGQCTPSDIIVSELG